MRQKNNNKAMEIFSPPPVHRAPRPPRPLLSSTHPPPASFSSLSSLLPCTRSTVAALHPDLMGLVQDGSLILVPKSRFGPVPAWRTGFAEPDRIWVLGTNHLSEKSADDVARVVRSVKADNVVVELCRSRAGIMYASDSEGNQDGPLLNSNMFALSGAKFFGAINRSINLGGQSALALRLLLAVFSSKISSGANRPFGDEFRAARKAAEEIGAQIVLGDRPIEITLERAWKSLTWNEKFTLITSLFRGITSPSIETREAEEKAATSPFELYEKLSKSYPSLLQPLIHERDTYIAWSLKRSKAVKDSKTVVGIIGKGHMNGVAHALMADQGDLRFRDLVGPTYQESHNNRWVKGLIRGVIRDLIIGFVIWALYEWVMSGLWVK